jgi:HK97 family phage major capsid protein
MTTELVQTIEQISTGVERFKRTHTDTLTQLRADVERLETCMARPGAALSASGAADAPIMLKTQDGRNLPMLSAKQRMRDHFREDDSEGFTLGGFARDAIVGSRKAASGPALVPTFVSANIIDKVRANCVVIDAGASTILIDGPTNLARLTGDPTVYQHTEGATDISESDITAAAISLNPKLLAVLIPLTVEVVQDSPNLDTLLMAAIAGAFAAKVDALSLATLLADTNIAKSLAAQDPAVWAKTLEAVGAALALNQQLPLAHISNPADYIARASQLSSTAGTWLGAPPVLNGMSQLQTTSISAGTALFGDFRQGFAVSMRTELRVEIVRHQKPTSASHLLVAHLRCDGVVLQPGVLFKQLKTVV